MKLSSKLAVFLITLQVADATLTGFGVNTFGIGAEGNPLVKYVMVELGVIPGLILVKMFAILCIGLLWKAKATNIILFLSGLYTSIVIMWLLAFYYN